MADIAIFRINYKSDFILTLQSDAGWTTPFCIKFWTGAPSKAYYAYYDGMSYTHCTPVEGEPTKLLVQFDDHHLPIGDLKFQIGYHFTVADFPTSVEDEVINQAAVIIDNDGERKQVMLDFNGETAPEIEFSLPAYANEAQRIANEQARIAAEEQRIVNEQARISAEETRQTNEQQRINQETARVSEFARLKTESEAATDAATSAANTANASAQNADEKATLANQKAQLAADKAALAQAAATLADDKAQLAADKASLAQQKADYAQTQGNYAKAQGDAAKTEAETAHSLNEEVSHDESTRQQQETARQEAEAQRATDFNTQMQQQQTAYTEAEAARETAFNEAEQQRDAKVDEKVADITNLQAQVGYFVCDTAAATAAKTITATGYVLGTGGSIRIKMTNANTADAVTLNINSTGAKALYYNGEQTSSTNSWEEGEVVEVYYDGTRFMASNSQGGGGDASKISYNNSQSGIAADNVQEAIDEIEATTQSINSDIYKPIEKSITYTTESGYLNKTGTEIIANNSYKTTNYIDVSEVNSILVTASSSGVYGTVYAYNSEQQAMFWLLNAGNYTSQEVSIPTEVKYVRVCGIASNFLIKTKGYILKSDACQTQINQIEEDIYTTFKEITYDESLIQSGFWRTDGATFSPYAGYAATPFIEVNAGSTIYIDTKSSAAGVNCLFSYDENQVYIKTIKTQGTFNKEEIQLADNEHYIKMNGQNIVPKVYKKGVGREASKKKLNFNVNWVGMSIWWYDGKTLASGPGGGVRAKGYQSLLREQYLFLSDTGVEYCISGASLGGISESDSYSIAANMSSWAASENAIWTLDTITNDFKRNIPIGTTDDYDNDTGVTTYLGALRKFADKVTELSGSSAIVIVSNGARRNNSGYTSTSQNNNGDTMQDFEKALMYVVVKKNWYFVDQYRLSALSDNVIPYATIDGLHLNNTGYKLAVIPWIAIFDMIYNSYL